jgi:hypothetical protein
MPLRPFPVAKRTFGDSAFVRGASAVPRADTMNALATVFALKIVATVVFWCLPLILLPASWLEAAGFPRQETYLFVRLLGWAYLALCVGYWFGWRSAAQGKRPLAPIWVGIVSNGAACAVLGYHGAIGAWASWGEVVQALGWASVAAAFSIALGLVVFGLFGQGEAA